MIPNETNFYVKIDAMYLFVTIVWYATLYKTI